MKFPFFAGVLAILGSSVMVASTVSYTLSANGTSTDTAPGWTDVLTIPKLDDAGAIMTGVEVQLVSDMVYTISNVNAASTALSYSYESDGALVLLDQSGLGLAWNLDVSGLASYQPVKGSFLASPGGFSVTVPVQQQIVKASVSGPSVLSPNPLMKLVGSGTWSLGLFSGQSGPDGSANGPFLVDQNGHRYNGISVFQDAQIEVTYTYQTTVPEPNCLVFCLLSLSSFLALPRVKAPLSISK